MHIPGFITHYICGQAVLNALPSEAQTVITKHAAVYNMGTQGPDFFFYYLPGLLKKRMRHIGTQMHTRNVGMFMEYLLACLPTHGETKNILFAYISGYLTHYALDSRAHPYIYYKTGTQRKSGALRDSVYHRKLETAIDVLLLQITSGEKPADYKLWQLIRADAHKARIVSKAVSHAARSAYNRDINENDVYKAMTYMVNLTRVLQSRQGRRKYCMERIENLLIGEPLISGIIHAQYVSGGEDYLNMAKKPWHLPWDAQTQKTDSFVDLYRAAAADGVQMVKMLYRYLQGGVSKRNLLQVIGNRSFATGAECL